MYNNFVRSPRLDFRSLAQADFFHGQNCYTLTETWNLHIQHKVYTCPGEDDTRGNIES